MSWYFAPTDRQGELNKEAFSWVGTPFHGRARVKGSGVDCVHLAAAIYGACGFLPALEFPHYSMDGGSHLTTSEVFKFVIDTGKFEQTDAALMPGDLLGFKMGNVVHHVGVCVINPQMFIHAYKGAGTIISWITDPTWKTRLLHVYRPIE